MSNSDAALIEKMAKARMNKEEMAKAEEEKAQLKGIPEFDSYFWLGEQIRLGQDKKPFLSMEDCQIFLAGAQLVYDYLKKLVKHEKNPHAAENFEEAKPELADADAFRALNLLKYILERLHESGHFSIEESALALSHLKRLQDVFVENIDPDFKQEQLEARLHEKTDELKNQRTGKGKQKGKKGGRRGK